MLQTKRNEEHEQLLKEAQTRGEGKEALIKRNTEIYKENEELKRVFLQITDERNTMIQDNELLNAPYQLIQQNTEGISMERMELKPKSDSIDKEYLRLETLL